MFIETALEAMMATSTPALLPLPTATHSKHHHHTSADTSFPTFTVGPDVHYELTGKTGGRTLWVVFVVMLISSLAFYVMAWRQPASKRLFHVLTAFITTFATLSYYAMAVGQGVSLSTSKSVEKGHPDILHITKREVYWARYVDWSVTTPLLLLDLAILAGLNGADITVAIVADVIMVITGMFGALTDGDSTGDKTASWAWYAMGCAAYLVIVYLLAVNGRATVKSKDAKTATFFTSIATYTLLLWTAYPVIWAIAEGTGAISLDSEIIAYAVLDILAKPGFGFWLLFTHDSLASSSATIGGFWAHGIASEGGIRVGDDEA